MMVFGRGVSHGPIAAEDLKGVLDEVLRLLSRRMKRSAQLQVLYAVVLADAVLMVNGLVAAQWSPEMARHDKDVFEDVPALPVGVCVPPCNNVTIAVLVGVSRTARCHWAERGQFPPIKTLTRMALAQLSRHGGSLAPLE
jgi:hypothetical protein